MDAVIQLLEFHCHHTHDVVDVHCIHLEGVRRRFNAHIRVEVNVVGKFGEFIVHRVS